MKILRIRHREALNRCRNSYLCVLWCSVVQCNEQFINHRAHGARREGLNQTFLSSSEQGSFSLQAAFVTLLAALFVGIGGNVASYLNAKNSVEQAARIVSRCLTPTDAECAQYESTPNGGTASWWGLKTTEAIDREHFVSRYNYSAILTETFWSASYDWYELHKVQPVVQLPVSQLAVVSAVGVLNRYAKRFVPVIRRTLEIKEHSELRLANSELLPGLFPRFNQTFELNQRDRSLRDWENGRNRLGTEQDKIPFTALPIAHATRDITDGETESFVSEWVRVPPLPSESEDLSCSDCEKISELVARKPRPADWARYAHVAIKGFAQVEPVRSSSSAEVRWGTAPVGPGLMIEYTRDATQHRASEGNPFYSRQLGGRDWEPVRSSQWVNLVLRGPAGSNGAGGHPDEQGDYHEDIRVPRGHWFRVTATFSARGGDVRVRPQLLYFIDEVVKNVTVTSEEVTSRCTAETQLFPGEEENAAIACPAEGRCPLIAKASTRDNQYRYQDIRCEKGNVILREEPTCELANAFELAAGDQTSSPDFSSPVSTVACRNDQLPSKDIFTAPPGRLVCGVVPNPVTPAQVLYGGADSSCGTANIVLKDVPCGNEVTFRNDGNYKVEKCTGLSEQINALNKTLASAVRSPTLVTVAAITLSTAPQYTFREFSPELWRASWEAKDENGSTVSGESTVQTNRVRVGTRKPTYLRTDEKKPALEEFDFIPPSNLNSFPLRFFAERVAIEEDVEKRRTIEASKTYPFANKPEIEIPYWGQTESPEFADYDGDCSLESSCDVTNLKYSSEEEYLRQKLAGEFPEVTDPKVIVEFFKEFVDVIQVADTGTFPTCTPFKTICTKRIVEGSQVYLGKFSTLEHPDGPPTCIGTDKIYDRCVRDGMSSVDGTFQLDFQPQIARAVSHGQRELQNLLPGVALGCNAPGCGTVAIDSPPGALKPNIVVSYNWPITPPLSVLLGENSLQLRSAQSESYELR